MHASNWVSQAGAEPPIVDLNRKCLSRENRELPWKRDASNSVCSVRWMLDVCGQGKTEGG